MPMTTDKPADKDRLADIRKQVERIPSYCTPNDVRYLLQLVDRLQGEVTPLKKQWEALSTKYVDMKAQLDRQREVLEKARDAIKNCRVIFNDIKNEHMDCAEGNVDDEHAMFHHAERGNKFCHDTLTTITDVLGEEDKR